MFLFFRYALRVVYFFFTALVMGLLLACVLHKSQKFRVCTGTFFLLIYRTHRKFRVYVYWCMGAVQNPQQFSGRTHRKFRVYGY